MNNLPKYPPTYLYKNSNRTSLLHRIGANFREWYFSWSNMYNKGGGGGESKSCRRGELAHAQKEVENAAGNVKPIYRKLMGPHCGKNPFHAPDYHSQLANKKWIRQRVLS